MEVSIVWDYFSKKEGEVAMWFVALIMLLFYGLAVCTIVGMVTIGTSATIAMTTATLEVILGVIIVRAMYRDFKRAQ